MALTDTFVKQVKPTGNAAGDKYRDHEVMYLHVKTAGKYWRMSYRFDSKQKTLALGTYPEVSLLKARSRRKDARALLAVCMAQHFWREGSNTALSGRFAALRVRPAHRDCLQTQVRAQEWFLIDWPEGEDEPAK